MDYIVCFDKVTWYALTRVTSLGDVKVVVLLGDGFCVDSRPSPCPMYVNVPD